jgi:hypothetical protein
LWDEVVSTTVYLQNRSPTKFLEHKTPYEAFNGYKPIVNHLRVFGSKAFSHIPKEIEGNLMQSQSNVFSLVIVLTIKLTKCMILLLIKSLQVGMLYFMSMQDDDSQDVLKLPEEGIESEKVEESEDQQDDVESQSGIEATSSKSTPRKSGATPPSK